MNPLPGTTCINDVSSRQVSLRSIDYHQYLSWNTRIAAPATNNQISTIQNSPGATLAWVGDSLSGMGLDLGIGLLPVKGWKESTEKHELWQKKETLWTHSKRRKLAKQTCAKEAIKEAIFCFLLFWNPHRIESNIPKKNMKLIGDRRHFMGGILFLLRAHGPQENKSPSYNQMLSNGIIVFLVWPQITFFEPNPRAMDGVQFTKNGLWTDNQDSWLSVHFCKHTPLI